MLPFGCAFEHGISLHDFSPLSTIETEFLAVLKIISLNNLLLNLSECQAPKFTLKVTLEFSIVTFHSVFLDFST